MRKIRNWQTATCAAVCLVGSILCWSASGLELGEKPPQLSVSEWVRGGPADLRATGSNFYAICFLESDCNACLQSISVLNELSGKYESNGLTVVAISGESVESLRHFSTNAGAKIKFTLGADRENTTYDAYMKSSGESTYPHVFLVDKRGVLVWHRHPLWGLAEAIEQLSSGRYNLKAEKRADAARKLCDEYLIQARTNAKPTALAARGKTIIKDGAGNPWMLNNFAWSILFDRRIKERDIVLALKAAREAFNAGGGTNAAFADTYAHALFANSDLVAAIRMQNTAVEYSENENEQEYFRGQIKLYQTTNGVSSKR